MNQDPITIEFDCEEHALLNDIILHAIESFDFAVSTLYDLPPEVEKRYYMLNAIKERSISLWSQRFSK